MATNPYVNKVMKSDGTTIIDISDSTVTAADMAQGVTAYDASGTKITGSMQGGLEMNVKFTAGNKVIPDYMFYNNHGSGSNSAYPIEEVVIGDGVTSIGQNAFYMCTELKSATIGNGVTSIGSSAFYYCRNLTNIAIPDSVTSIDRFTFGYCSRLKSATIGNGVTSIEYNAFQNCTSLTSVTIGNGVTSIDRNAFNSCSNLTTITVDKPQDSISGSPWGAYNATIIWTG